MILQKSRVESLLHRPGDHILLSADKYEIKVGEAPRTTTQNHHLEPAPVSSGGLSAPQVWPLGREINCRCLKTLTVSEDRSISLQPRLQFDGRHIVCSSDLGIHQWDFASFEVLR